MKRADKLIQKYKQYLLNKRIENIPEFVEQIISADITKGKYTSFLLDCFINNKFRVEDLQGGLESSIGQAVSLFHKYKSKLSEDMRSVNKYSSPGDLWNAVKQYEQVMTGKEIDNNTKDIIYSQSDFIIDQEFKIIVPLTIEAAQWWGKGTRWCTSANNNNMFIDYASISPILIIIMPTNTGKIKKIQAFKHNIDSKESVIMDEADNELNIQYIEKNWTILGPIIQYLNNPKYFPKDKHNYFEFYSFKIKNINKDNILEMFFEDRVTDYIREELYLPIYEEIKKLYKK